MESPGSSTNTSTTGAPPLPPRKSVESHNSNGEIGLGISSKMNDLHLSNTHEYDTQTNPVSVLLVQRQLSSYTLPNMNEYSDVFAVKSMSDELLKNMVQPIIEGSDNQFWNTLLSTSGSLDFFSRDKELEDNLDLGIPGSLRGVIYLKVLHVRYQLTKEKYNNLLNKSIHKSDLPLKSDIDQVENEGAKRALQVFNYYINAVAAHGKYDTTDGLKSQDKNRHLPKMIRVGQLLAEIPELTEEQMLYILLKFNRIFGNANIDELCYCICRSIEDSMPDLFVLITKQGISIKTIAMNIIDNFLIKLDDATALMVLDFIVFEGMSWLTRLSTGVIQEQRSKIMELKNDQLELFLTSDLFEDKIDFTLILTTEPDLVKYENEYYLIHINSLSNNNYELVNCQEIQEELLGRISSLKSEIDSLRTTHTEILEQYKEYEKEIAEKEAISQQLTVKYTELKDRFDKITMKANLDNTIKANGEFRDRNSELEGQIEQLKRTIDAKAQKLAKYT